MADQSLKLPSKDRFISAFLNRRLQMGWAALVIGTSVLISRFMGLIRDKVISYFFGATQESDLYFAAFVIPDFINYLLAGAYFSITLIPMLASYFEKDKKEAWQFFSAVLFWVALTIVAITAVAEIFVHPLAKVAAPGLDRMGHERLAFFLRIILPAQIFFLLGSCVSAILYLRKQFLIPALSPLIYNLMIIIGGILMRDRGMEGFCWGVLAGSILGNFLAPFLAAKYGEGMKLCWTFFHPGLKRFLVLALPLMLGQSVVVLDEQLVRVFGSMCGAGAISWLNYARRIMLVPVGVVAQAAGVASYPFLADLLVKNQAEKFHQTINMALRNTLTLLVPLSVWMVVVAEPTIKVIFQQGHFQWTDTQQTSTLLQIMLTVVFCWGFQQIIGRAYYARQDTLTPALIGTIATLVSIPIYFVVVRAWSAIGVAITSSLSVAIYTLMLTLWWRRKWGKDVFSGLGKDFIKLFSISIVAAVGASSVKISGVLDSNEHLYLSAAATIGLSGFVFLTIFLVISRYFIKDTVVSLMRKRW